VIDKWRYPHDVRGFEYSMLRLILLRPKIPAGRFIPAGRALERQALTLEVQERVVSVETAEELSNLLGNHCCRNPFPNYQV
jgi:hypothetical protein